MRAARVAILIALVLATPVRGAPPAPGASDALGPVLVPDRPDANADLQDLAQRIDALQRHAAAHAAHDALARARQALDAARSARAGGRIEAAERKRLLVEAALLLAERRIARALAEEELAAAERRALTAEAEATQTAVEAKILEARLAAGAKSP